MACEKVHDTFAELRGEVQIPEENVWDVCTENRAIANEEHLNIGPSMSIQYFKLQNSMSSTD